MRARRRQCRARPHWTTSERLEAARRAPAWGGDVSVSRRARLRRGPLRLRSLRPDVDVRQRAHNRAFLGPAATGGGVVEREPAVAAFVVGEAADQSGLDRAAPAGEALGGA